MTSIGRRQQQRLISRLSASISSLFRRSYSPSGILSSSDDSPSTNDVNNGAAKAVELLSWGRGSCGQLGGGLEKSRLWPTSVSSFHLPPDFGLSPVSGRLPKSSSPASVEVGISCGLFHFAVLIDGKFWVWGKEDGGRLGLGNEESVFTPVLNPYLENVRNIALGGLHSCALTTNGDVFAWGYGGVCWRLVILSTTRSCSLGFCSMIGMEELVILQLVELILQLFLSLILPLMG